MPPGPRVSGWRSMASAVARRLGRGRTTERRTTAGARTAELVTTARRASDERRWPEAVAAWRVALEAGAVDRATGLTHLGQAYRRGQELDTAEEVLAGAAEEFPDHVGVATEHANVAVSARDWGRAAARWGRVIDLAGDDADARAFAQLARAQAQLDDVDAAAATLARARTRHPDDTTLAVEHARLATAAHDWPEAIQRWQGVLTTTAPNPPAEVFGQLAKAHQQLGEPRTAAAVLDRGLSLHPEDVDLVARHARLANVDRDWPEVVRRWEGLLDLAADAAPGIAYTQLARAHQAQGDIDAAERVLELGRSRLPEDVEVATRWAKLAAAVRDWERAEQRYAIAVGLPEPAPPEVHRDRARAAAELEAWDRAEEALTAGLDQHPDDPTLLVERAFLAVQRGDWAQVETRWSDALARADVPAELYVAMARRCAAAFEHDRADAVVEAGLVRHPDDRALQRQLVRNAISYQRREHAPADWDWTASLARARRVVASYGSTDSEPEDHLHLATELADTTALPEAIAVLREGLATHPGARTLRHEIGVLSAALGRWDDAAEALRPLTASTDVPATTRSALVRAEFRRGEHRAAVALVGDPAGVDGETAWQHGELAWLATASGDHEAAADHWRAVRELTPGSSDVHRHLAVSLRNAGDDAAAADTVAAARAAGVTLETNPGVVAIIGGGPSLRGVDLTPLHGVAHVVAVNATATVLPWSDVAVTHDASHLVERFRGYDGPVVAGLPLAALHDRGTLTGFRFRRRLVTDRLSELDDVVHSGGHTSAHTALNYAYLLRPTRIVLFGVDLTEFWGPNDYWHGAMDDFNRLRYADLEARATFDRWSRYRARKLEDAPAVFASTVPQLTSAGIEVLNASPVSSVTCYPKLTPEDGVKACLAGDLGPAT
jgi:tetratricopeptide (TPR) repeat protein